MRTLKRLGPNDRLVEWRPSNPRQRRELPESIRLRVIDYQIKGFRPTGVVTNVLDPARISREAWIHLATKEEEGRLRLAQGLYHRRWEIETTYHELKVTQGMETTLRSRTPEGIAYEVAGHVLLYFLVRWLIVEAAATENADPLRISFKGALDRTARHGAGSDHHADHPCGACSASAAPGAHRGTPRTLSARPLLPETTRRQNQKSWPRQNPTTK